MDNDVKNGNLQMVDLMKFILAILVITIHSSPLTGSYDYILTGIIARIAVPFFFISSGYILYAKLQVNTLYIRKYIKRLIILYTSWYLLYLIWRILFEFRDIGVKDIILLIREYVFSGYYQLWYLPSLIISVIFIYFFIKIDKINYLIPISIMLFIICVLGDSYKGVINISLINKLINLYNIVFGATKSGICFVVPFLTIGLLIKKYNFYIKKDILNILLVFTVIIFVYEGLILKYNNIESARNIYFTSILIVPVIFIKILQSKKTISYRMSNLFRSLSLGIYCSHALFIMIFNTLYQIDILEYFLIKRFLFVCITSIFYSYILYKIKNKKKSFKYVSIE